MEGFAFENLISMTADGSEIYVGNISHHVDLNFLITKFATYGKIRFVISPLNCNSAVIQYERPASALHAIQSANRYNLGGQRIVVQTNMPRGPVSVPVANKDQLVDDEQPAAKRRAVEGEDFDGIAALQGQVCVIVIPGSQFVPLGQEIGRQLHKSGIQASLLIPHGQMHITDVFKSIQSRGCHYGVLLLPVAPNNLTFTIIYDPFKYRCLRVEDAISFIKDDFSNKAEGIIHPNLGAVSRPGADGALNEPSTSSAQPNVLTAVERLEREILQKIVSKALIGKLEAVKFLQANPERIRTICVALKKSQHPPAAIPIECSDIQINRSETIAAAEAEVFVQKAESEMSGEETDGNVRAGQDPWLKSEAVEGSAAPTESTEAQNSQPGAIVATEPDVSMLKAKAKKLEERANSAQSEPDENLNNEERSSGSNNTQELLRSIPNYQELYDNLRLPELLRIIQEQNEERARRDQQ